MKTRLIYTFYISALLFLYLAVLHPALDARTAAIAVRQGTNDPNAFVAINAAPWQHYAVLLLFLIGYATLWFGPLMQWLYDHRKDTRILGAFLVVLLLASGCASTAEIHEIQANQTAFLLPLTGDTAAQVKVQSVEFLKSNQVAVKQVTIPRSWRKTGGMPWQGDYYPDVKLIVVDRSLVTRQWTKSDKTGTTPTDQSFGVESSESVGFSVGATCTAMIDEADAATFLYNYGDKGLAEIMDTNIRGEAQALLFSQFAGRTVVQAQADKQKIFDTVRASLITTFKAKGITITSFGGSEGLVYDNQKVQDEIDKSYSASQGVFQAQAQATKQSIENKAMLDQANAWATATVVAGQAQAEVIKANGQALKDNPDVINYTLAQKSSGQVPQILVLGAGTAGSLPFSFMLTPPAPTPAPTPH